ncbi:MAG: lamin tail domain-containing protein [Clostridia bacterium]|nr:lamin tail domain-containing protein [Clostridia bacterium]
MKRILRVLALLLIAALLGGCGAESGGSSVRLFAVNVGKGDALILKAGDWVGLIDAGKPRAMGRVRAALKGLGVEKLNAVFLTHTDDDHAGGLDWLAQSDMPVDNWYAPAMYTGVKEKKHPMVLAAALRGQAVQWLQRGDALSLPGGATLRVLAPASLFEDKDDNNSLVMMLESGQGKMLLTGDMELPEEAELLGQGDDLRCAVLKVPNHGDDDTTSAEFAKAASARVAVISTDSQEKPGTPDPGVVRRLEAAGTTVVVTQDAGMGLLVTLEGGEATVKPVDIEATPVSGPYIADVDPDDDTIALGNSGSANVDLSGFSLYSDKGGELYAFPEGTVLSPGATLTVGTNSTDGNYDLLWDDKKVVNKKKTDTFYLYDDYGRIVDSRDNGR